MTMTSDELATAAADHLWLHFSPPLRGGRRAPHGDRAGRGRLRVGRPRATATSTAWPGSSWCRPATAGWRSPRPPAARPPSSAYFPLWTYAHPTAIELAARLAALAPGDLNRVFFTTGGGEAVESAWKLARQYFVAIGQPDRVKVISRQTAYHGTTLGALNITGLDAIKEPFLPLLNGQARHVPNTPDGAARQPRRRARRCRRHRGDDHRRGARDRRRRVPRAGAERGRLPRAAARLLPAGARDLRSPRRAARERRGDLRLRAPRRPGSASSRLGYQPDMITFAKGVTSGYSPARRRAGERPPRRALPRRGHARSSTASPSRGHPVSCAVALANLDVMEREDLPGRVLEPRGRVPRHARDASPTSRSSPRCAGWATSTGSSSPRTAADFTDDECEWLIRGFLSKRLLELGLICRADDRGDPVIQLSPSLVAGPEEFDGIRDRIHQALLEAWKELDR